LKKDGDCLAAFASSELRATLLMDCVVTAFTSTGAREAVEVVVDFLVVVEAALLLTATSSPPPETRTVTVLVE